MPGRVLLLEDTYSFNPTSSDITSLQESVRKGDLKYPVEIRGRLSAIGVLNDNHRIYPAKVWEKQLAKNSSLRQLIHHRRSLGLLEHPADGKVSLQSPISHVLMDVKMEGTEVWGTLGFINTGEGNKMIALIEAGYNPLVSSRGYGSVQTVNGVDEVQEDYVCEGWDVVYNPSFKDAELDGKSFRDRFAKFGESVDTPEKVFATINRLISEGKIQGNVRLQGGCVFITPERLEEGSPSKPATPTLTPVTTPVIAPTTPPTPITEAIQPTANMTDKLKPIQEALAPVTALDTAKIGFKGITDQLTRLGDLHRTAAAIGATDPNLSWDVQQAHASISAQESRLNEALQAPALRATKLEEDRTKLMRVLKTVLETSIKYKKAAANAVNEASKRAKKLGETVQKGRGWVDRARKAESVAKSLNARYDFACKSLDEAQALYKKHTTDLGRRVLQLEFKVTDPEKLKAINEATTITQLGAIRDSLEGKPGEKIVPEKHGKLPQEAKFGRMRDRLRDTKDDKDEAGNTLESAMSHLLGIAAVTPTASPVAPAATPAATAPAATAPVEAPKVESTPAAPAATTPAAPQPAAVPFPSSTTPTSALVEAVFMSKPRGFSINETIASVKRLSEAAKQPTRDAIPSTVLETVTS